MTLAPEHGWKEAWFDTSDSFPPTFFCLCGRPLKRYVILSSQLATQTQPPKPVADMPVAFFHRVHGEAEVIRDGVSLTDEDGHAEGVAHVECDIKYDFLAIFKGDTTLNLLASTAESADFMVESKPETPEVIELRSLVAVLSRRDGTWGEVVMGYLQEIDKQDRIQRRWFNGAIKRDGTKGAIGDVKNAK